MCRITEGEIMIEALRFLRTQPNGSANVSDLIENLTRIMSPTGKDAEIIEGRSDTYFSQKVRNLVSHRNAANGIVTLGLVTYSDLTRPGVLTIIT